MHVFETASAEGTRLFITDLVSGRRPPGRKIQVSHSKQQQVLKALGCLLPTGFALIQHCLGGSMMAAFLGILNDRMVLGFF